MRGARALFAAAVLVTCEPASAQQATPLFAGEAPLRLTINGPIAAITRNRSDNAPAQAATLQIGAETLPITLAPRGITRRKSETCQFPPLRVQFPAAPPAASVFAGQKRLKLVTHCRSAESFQDYVLLEHAAYRLLNLLTPLSFRTRLAIIDYAGADGRPATTRYGFFIEEVDELASRNGLRRASTGDRVAASALSPAEAGRAALFEYMIGNLDWSMRAGPRGEGCCHNFRLLSGPGSSLLKPVPYDFDFSGLVDAPYAVPQTALGVGTVRERLYRGYCMHNAQALAAAAEFRTKRPQIIAMLGQQPIKESSRRKATAYLERFFADIADDSTMRSRLLRNCIG